MKFTVNGHVWDSDRLMSVGVLRNRVGGLWRLSYASGSAGGFIHSLVESEPGVFRSATPDEEKAEQDWWDEIRKMYYADGDVSTMMGDSPIDTGADK